MLKKLSLCFFLLLILFRGGKICPAEDFAFTLDKEDSFCLSKRWDPAIITAGILSYGSILAIKHFADPEEYDKSKVYNKEDVNPLDRLFMQPYDAKLDTAGTISCGAAMAVIPAAIYLAEYIEGDFSSSQIFDVSVMYVETLLFTNALKDWMKFSVKRQRPYMYFDQKDSASLEDGDFSYSWPSGHTANAFAGATFISYTFCTYFPDSSWKIPVIAASYTFAAGTGILRMASGNHFLTDVLSGALIGSACGFLVPFVHHRFAMSKNQGQTSFYLTPCGVNIHLNL